MATPETGHVTIARPRPDDTPPRNGVIFTYTLLAVMTLGGLSFVFSSYLDVSRRDQVRMNIEGSRASMELEAYRQAQAEALRGGAMPIDRAMSDFARRGRTAFPLIRPTPSSDLDPLRGWSELPRAVGDEAAAPAEAATPAEGEAPAEGAAPADGAAPAEEAVPTEAAAPAEDAPAEGEAPEGAAPAPE